MTAVHQLVHVLTSGDAIGGAALEARQMFTELGFDSTIYAGAIDPRLRHEAKPAEQLPGEVGVDDLVIYHFSLGSALTELWTHLPSRRAIFYHNITPAHYFDDVSARVAYDLRAGRDHLRDVISVAELCVANSTYSLSELRYLGATSTVVIPPAADLSRLDPTPAPMQTTPTLLFVGRLAPNKRHDTLLLVLKAMRETSHPDARLVLIGGQIDTEPYVQALEFQAQELGVAGATTILRTGITDQQLREHYLGASVFVCASGHEGFCVPLLEAMAFSIPVVALDAGAVHETVADAGVIMQTRDPLVWAAVIDRVLEDAGLRTTLIDAGTRRVADFDKSKIKERYSAALSSIGVVAQQ